MVYKNKDLLQIIKIQNKTIVAAAAAARTLKKQLKLTTKLYKKAFKHWLEEMDVAAGLKIDGQYIWDERNKAVYDYNALYALFKLQRVTQLPEYEDYELPDGTEVKDCVLDIEGRMMESGRLRPIAHLIKIPEDNPAWDTKFREQSYSFKDLIKKRKKGKK